MSGKGDRQRPVDKETYDKNYEEIDWSKTKEHESSEYECFNNWKRKTKQKKRSALYNSIKKYKLESRTKWINEGSVVIDDKYYYYCQSKKVRVKGNNKYYKMRGFSHFYDTFLGDNNEK